MVDLLRPDVIKATDFSTGADPPLFTTFRKPHKQIQLLFQSLQEKIYSPPACMI